MEKGKFDELKDLAKKGQDLVAEHPDAVKQALRKAALAADATTGGKFRQKLFSAEAKAAQLVDKQQFEKQLDDAQAAHEEHVAEPEEVAGGPAVAEPEEVAGPEVAGRQEEAAGPEVAGTGL